MIERLSEASDVFFAMSRAKYDGYPIAELPSLGLRSIPVYGYMLAKFTSRWAFYRALAFLCGAAAPGTVREVVTLPRTTSWRPLRLVTALTLRLSK